MTTLFTGACLLRCIVLYLFSRQAKTNQAEVQLGLQACGVYASLLGALSAALVKLSMLLIDSQSVVGSSPTHPWREALLFETVVLYMELLASYNLVHTPLKGFVINHKKQNLLQTEHEVAKCTCCY